MIEKHKSKITQLNPLQESAYIYNPKRWEKLDSYAQQLVKHFEKKPITRQDIITAFAQYYNNKASMLYPFTLAMLWGFGDTGYGTYRTNAYLSKPESINQITAALAAVKNNNIKQAYGLLQHIKGLNISYISKLLYFASRACNHTTYCLIFDIRVARALVSLATQPIIASFIEVTPSSKYSDYEQYNTLLHQWAKTLAVPAENIECFLFDYNPNK